MTATLTVRAAQLDDLETIVELRLSLVREYRDHPFYARERPDATARARELFHSQLLSPNEVMLVAECDGAIIGIMRCVDTPVSPLLLPERYCYVSSVFVRPTHRRAGALVALLRAADAWCASRGIDEMRLHNSIGSIASKAWQSVGFETVEEVRRRSLRVTTPASITAVTPERHFAGH